MKVAFQKWGNSLALRVPKVVAQEIGASDGKTAEMSVRDGKS
jgi:antitoxin MazE